MTHNARTIADEIATLSARALLHRANIGLKFEHDGLAYVGSILSAKFLEHQAEQLAKQLAKLPEDEVQP